MFARLISMAESLGCGLASNLSEDCCKEMYLVVELEAQTGQTGVCIVMARLLVTTWMESPQAPWDSQARMLGGLTSPPLRDLSYLGMELGSPALQGRFYCQTIWKAPAQGQGRAEEMPCVPPLGGGPAFSTSLLYPFTSSCMTHPFTKVVIPSLPRAGHVLSTGTRRLKSRNPDSSCLEGVRTVGAPDLILTPKWRAAAAEKGGLPQGLQSP